MLLSDEKSLCAKDQKIIVSKDRGTSRIHKAYNPDKKYCVRHYKLDGDIIKNRKCCDFLLLNDTSRHAYLIELKGGNIDEAVPQLEAGAQLCRTEVPEYTLYYRIVCSKARTHDIRKSIFRKFRARCGSQLKCASQVMQEDLK